MPKAHALRWDRCSGILPARRRCRRFFYRLQNGTVSFDLPVDERAQEIGVKKVDIYIGGSSLDEAVKYAETITLNEQAVITYVYTASFKTSLDGKFGSADEAKAEGTYENEGKEIDTLVKQAKTEIKAAKTVKAVSEIVDEVKEEVPDVVEDIKERVEELKED